MKNIGGLFFLLLLFCLTSCASPPAMQSAPQASQEFTRSELSFKEGMDRIAGGVASFMRDHGWERAAISDFKANIGADASLENSIAGEITRNVGSIKGVSVVEKADSDRVLKYLKTSLYEMAHPTSDSTFVLKQELLKKYGDKTYADIILGGMFAVRDEKIYLVAYFVETKTGRIYLQKFDGIARNDGVSQDRQPQQTARNSFRDCPDCPEMIAVPGRNYALGKSEVTQAEWGALMGSNPSNFKGANLPVEQVSWDDAQDYIKRLNQKTGKNYRLPTEAEWAYACYGGNQTEYCGSNDINAVAWYGDNSGNQTHAVGQKQANGYGLYDMSGNVYEWMDDCYAGKCNIGRQLRGGSWANNPESARAAKRVGDGTGIRNKFIGFRLARTLSNSALPSNQRNLFGPGGSVFGPGIPIR